jgi:hypothetical protein
VVGRGLAAATLPGILALGEVSPGSGATVGGKAAQLADLMRAGFPVLPGIVVNYCKPILSLLAARSRRGSDCWPSIHSFRGRSSSSHPLETLWT